VSQREQAALLHTRSGVHAVQLEVAAGFWRRFRGLMLRRQLPAGHGLLLTACSSVHTCFMRFALDLVYLDRQGKVLRCVQNVKPWRASNSGALLSRAGVAHCMELPAGSIARYGLAPGDTVAHPALQHPAREETPGRAVQQQQRGAAMVEFVVVGPLLTLLGLAVIQYAMLFFAKNQINHATFMAARAGSTSHADLGAITQAYTRNLVALYGGGTDSAELNASLLRAEADVAVNAEIQLLNPTKESFDDWNDPVLERANGRRTIAKSGLAFRDLVRVGSASGQNLQDANLIKVRVLHGYEPKVPLMRLVYTRYLKWMDNRLDPTYTRLIEAGRIPIVSDATLQMQSDPMEGSVMSIPGPGNGGRPTDPGEPPRTTDPPPWCATIGCTVPGTPSDPPNPGCNPNTDPNGCRPPWCRDGDPRCDPTCGVSRCCQLN